MASSATLPAPDRRLFAVGDIHGQADALARLFDALPYRPGRDRLIFLGDYINRGPNSRGVLDALAALRQNDPSAVFLMGNHEETLLRYAASGDPQDLQLLRSLGIEATLASYGDPPAAGLRHLACLPPEHREFLANLSLYHRVPPYLFVHAGLPAGTDPETCPPDCLLAARHAFLAEPAPEGTTVVFGHTPARTPLLAPGKIGVDTGAAWGGPLSAVSLPDLTWWHA